MERARWQFVGLCTWLFLLYNIERLDDPINIASFVYVYTLMVAVATIILPRIDRIPTFTLFLLLLPPYAVGKIYFGLPFGGAKLPITITEIFAIGMTMFMTRRLRESLESLFTVVQQLTIETASEPRPFASGQGHIYREIRRARHYERPATLLSIAPREASIEWSFLRYIQEAQQKIIRKYIDASLARMLVAELKDCDVVTLRDDHFVVLLPEIEEDEAEEIARRLMAVAQDRLSLNLKIGKATFPQEAITFESLLIQAEERMNNSSSTGQDTQFAVTSSDGQLPEKQKELV